ncbi:MAG: hypothetical protein RSE41_00815 [Clostridia bacterium]
MTKLIEFYKFLFNALEELLYPYEMIGRIVFLLLSNVLFNSWCFFINNDLISIILFALFLQIQIYAISKIDCKMCYKSYDYSNDISTLIYCLVFIIFKCL